jgi:hypothetical protein
MTTIIIFLPISGLLFSSFDLRMSSFTQRLNLVYADNAGCSFQSSCRNVDRLLRELPDRDDRSENQERVECRLDQIASFFFRTYQKRVSRFLVFVFWLAGVDCLFFHDRSFCGKAIGRDDNDHQISAKLASHGFRRRNSTRAYCVKWQLWGQPPSSRSDATARPPLTSWSVSEFVSIRGLNGQRSQITSSFSSKFSELIRMA